jgi:SAM-dependent methyltransferase
VWRLWYHGNSRPERFSNQGRRQDADLRERQIPMPRFESMPDYDRVAGSFNKHRALPDGVPEQIRAAILNSLRVQPRPRLLDLGSGSGRIGLPFVSEGDDYVGVDLSLTMLREFTRRASTGNSGRVPVVVQGDGRSLPFFDGTFDAVIIVNVMSSVQRWLPLIEEVWRVLRAPAGLLVVGRSLRPEGGLDQAMKSGLASILHALNVRSDREQLSQKQRWIDFLKRADDRLIVAEWEERTTPRRFLDRQQTGVRIAALPGKIRDAALWALERWAIETFGSVDAVSIERHAFELRLFRRRVEP